MNRFPASGPVLGDCGSGSGGLLESLPQAAKGPSTTKSAVAFQNLQSV